MYATLQDLLDRFGLDELLHHTDRAGTGQPDAAVVGRALADAEAVIDRHLAARYALPLTQPDPGLTLIACNLARYNYQGQSVEHDGIVERNYKAAIQALRDLAAGTTRLLAQGVPAAAPAGGGIGIAAPARVFTGAAMAGFVPGPEGWR